MIKEGVIEQLKSVEEFFERSTRCLDDSDSDFAPTEGTFSAAHQIAHAAQTIDWFMEGMFSPDGFDLDFAKHEQEVRRCSSVSDAKKWFSEAMERAIKLIEKKSDADLLTPLPPGPVMGGAPRSACIGAIQDHTAHHRGALTVYSRLLGKTPLMPYGEA